MRAVVVDRQAAADVEDAHRGALLDEVHVDPDRLVGGLPDGADVGQLRPLVEVEEPQAVEEVLLLQQVDGINELRGVEAEGRPVAAGPGPEALGLGREPEADAELGLDAEARGTA